MIKKIVCENIRIYEQVLAEFNKPCTTFFGSNGSGKTTLLESLYVVGTTKSFRTSQTKEMLRMGQPRGSVFVEKNNGDEITIEFNHGKKSYLKNGEKISTADCAKDLPMVVLAPEHNEITKGSPEKRRKYLDQIAFHQNHLYLSILQKYSKALRHKRALLSSNLPIAVYMDQAQVWNNTLVELSEQIQKDRQNALNSIIHFANQNHREISSKPTELHLTYKTPESFVEEREEKEQREYYAQRVLWGPHLDDVSMFIGDSDVKQNASQGENATVLLALTFAQIQLLESLDKAPILLLDDVGNTLDPDRRKALFSFLSDTPLQTLITTSDPQICTRAEEIGSTIYQKSEISNPADIRAHQWKEVDALPFSVAP